MMKKLRVLFMFFIIFVGLFAVTLKVNGAGSLTLTDGAQIRTTGEEGIRFTLNTNSTEAYEEVGFVLTKGTYSYDELKEAANNVTSWNDIPSYVGQDYSYQSGTANGINMIKVTNSDQGEEKFTLVVYGITEKDYLTDLSVIAFGKTGETLEYSTIGVSRNVTEVALQEKSVNGTSSNLIDHICEYAKNNFLKSGTDFEGNSVTVALDHLLLEDIQKLEVEFVNDMNEIAGTTLTVDSTMEDYSTQLTNDDFQQAAVYKLYNSKYQAKWEWLYRYMANAAVTTDGSSSAVHPRVQACQVIDYTGEEVINGTSYTKFYGGDHLSAAFYIFFNNSKSTHTFLKYYLDMDFTTNDSYYNVDHYIISNGYNFIYFANSNLLQREILIVNDDWSTLANDTIVEDNGFKYTIGTDAFGTIQEALDVVNKGGEIKVLAGTYEGNLNITKDEVVLVGPNAGIAGNSEDRISEAHIKDSTITLAADLAGITIDGFNLTGTTNIVNTVSAAGIDALNIHTNLDNFNLTNNVVSSAADTIFINFSSTASYAYNNNTRIMNNYFTQETGTTYAAKYISMNNERNITVEGNVFANFNSEVFYFDDQNKGFSGTAVNINNNNFTNINANVFNLDWLAPDAGTNASEYNINYNTVNNVTGHFMYIARIAVNENATGVQLNMIGNNMNTITKSVIYVARTTFTAGDSTGLGVLIELNKFTNIDGGATLDFEESNGTSTYCNMDNFVVQKNVFNDCWKGLWVGHLGGVKFTNNVYYKYAGSLSSTNAYVCRGSASYPIDAATNLYLSTDGNTVYTDPVAQGSYVFNGNTTSVNNINTSNYESIQAYKDANPDVNF